MLLLQPQPTGEIEEDESLGLWDDNDFEVAAGRNYADPEDIDF
jgi:hypothetical protein